MQFSMNDDKSKCSEDSISYDSGKLPSDLDTNSEVDYLPSSDNTSSSISTYNSHQGSSNSQMSSISDPSENKHANNYEIQEDEISCESADQ
jgi:hypothetical protein